MRIRCEHSDLTCDINFLKHFRGKPKKCKVIQNLKLNPKVCLHLLLSVWVLHNLKQKSNFI